MTQQLLVITAADLATIQGEIAEIRRILEGRADGWLSIPDMAAECGVSRATVNKGVREGRTDHEGRRLTAKGSGAARKVRWERWTTKIAA